MKLWLDDVRTAPHGWTWARTAREAIALLEEHREFITEISLDHDLGATPEDGYFAAGQAEETGFMVACFIADTTPVPFETPIRIHSWNSAGANAMAYELIDGGYDPIVLPFTFMELQQT